MSKFIEITNGQDGKIIWIENIDGDVCGICENQTVIDVDGLPSSQQEMGADIFTVLESYDFELQQDWDNEETIIELQDSNRENCKLVFSGSTVELINDKGDTA